MPETNPTPAETAPAERMSGAGRVLIVVYVILAIAATCRSIYQIITEFETAPVSYLLSAVSGVVYIVATVALINRAKPAWRAVAWVAISFELIGVVVVGLLSFVLPDIFANHASVWSWFGAGYFCIPLVLPVLGLIWLARTRGARPDSTSQASEGAPSCA